MRRSQSLLLALACLVCTFALAGVTSASANVLCSVNSDPCPSANIYPSGTAITGAGSSWVMTSSGGVINPRYTCSSTTVGLQTTAMTGIPVSATAWAMRSCTSTAPAGCSTSPTTTGLPTTGSIAAFPSGNGTLSVTTPTFSIACSIGSTTLTCSFGGNAVVASITGGRPATLGLVSVALTGTGAGCPTAWRATASYTLAPSALYVETTP
jgi:hypothetical protein